MPVMTNPAPIAIPIADVAHIPAAVVMPRIASRRYIIMPAPKKPMPETTCADISVSCAYDLPILDRKQEAGSGNFIKRGKERLEHIFAGIDANDFEPHPSPLCAWCPFSPTNENQPEEGKNLCPYYSLWTRGNHTFKVAHKWEGMDRHPTIMKEEKLRKLRETLGIDFDF